MASNDEDWKRERALRGYAAEGVHMSIKQMSGQLLSVDIADQERYIDLQRMRARQVWDECKHSKLHADVLLGKGWIKDERELEDIAAGQCPAVAGLFRHVDDVPAHPPAWPAPRRTTTRRPMPASASWPISTGSPTPWCAHEHLSQRDEELMHFMEGKFQIDFLCATPETQQPVEEALGYLLHQIGGIR